MLILSTLNSVNKMLFQVLLSIKYHVCWWSKHTEGLPHRGGWRGEVWLCNENCDKGKLRLQISLTNYLIFICGKVVLIAQWYTRFVISGLHNFIQELPSSRRTIYKIKRSRVAPKVQSPSYAQLTQSHIK